MCRILAVTSSELFSVAEHLEAFACIARDSREYQGHGWGCAYFKNNKWVVYKDIKPIWEDNLDTFGTTTHLVAHARSAFQDKDIRVENNMPFTSGGIIYIFNGELRGVKIQEKGRIGAEKIFNFILRFNNDDLLNALNKGVGIIENRSRYVKAMNIVIAYQDKAYLNSFFNEDEEYFTMYTRNDNNNVIICSDPLPGENDWQKIDNRTIKVF